MAASGQGCLLARTPEDAALFKEKSEQVSSLVDNAHSLVFAFECELSALHERFAASFVEIRGRAEAVYSPSCAHADTTYDGVKDRKMLRASAQIVPELLDAHPLRLVATQESRVRYKALLKQVEGVALLCQTAGKASEALCKLQGMLGACSNSDTAPGGLGLTVDGRFESDLMDLPIPMQRSIRITLGALHDTLLPGPPTPAVLQDRTSSSAVVHLLSPPNCSPTSLRSFDVQWAAEGDIAASSASAGDSGDDGEDDVWQRCASCAQCDGQGQGQEGQGQGQGSDSSNSSFSGAAAAKEFVLASASPGLDMKVWNTVVRLNPTWDQTIQGTATAMLLKLSSTKVQELLDNDATMAAACAQMGEVLGQGRAPAVEEEEEEEAEAAAAAAAAASSLPSAFQWCDEATEGVGCTSSFTISGLANGTNYALRYRARNALGLGSWSSPSVFTTQLHDIDMQRFVERLAARKCELERDPGGMAAGPHTVTVDRRAGGSVLQDTLDAFTSDGAPLSRWTGGVEVCFKGEEGVDCGGLLREWLRLVSSEVFDPKYGLFTTTAAVAAGSGGGGGGNHALHPSSRSADWHEGDDTKLFFRFCGRLLGTALLERVPLQLNLSTALLKRLLGREPDLEDMKGFDEQLYRTYRLVATLPNVSDLMATLSLETFEGGRRRVHDLVPAGRSVPVTDANKAEYVRLAVLYKLETGIEEQLHEIEAGFLELVPSSVVSQVSVSDLALALCGTAVIDIAEWRSHTQVDGGAGGGAEESESAKQTVAWFWECVAEMSNTDRQRLLQFSTGFPVPPAGGFSAGFGGDKFTLCLVGNVSPDTLPAAHTCFATIDLPCTYRSKDVMMHKLGLCLSCDSFGLL